MNDKPEAFGVAWFDLMLGELYLPKPTSEAARELARNILERGPDKARDVRLLMVAEGSNELTVIPVSLNDFRKEAT